MSHYDVIIIGTGAGGGTLLHELAATGKQILVLERGPFLPREKENWDTKVAFNTTRYFGPEDCETLIVASGIVTRAARSAAFDAGGLHDQQDDLSSRWNVG
mgnify:CR=1 FL=1